MMSLVLWYSVVPLKCLNVCNVILFILGLFSLVAVLFLSSSYDVLSECFFIVHSFSVFRFSVLSIPLSFSLIGRILGLLPFDGVIDMVLRSVSMSIHLSFINSSVLIPVSFSICRYVAYRLFADDISWSISCSVGMNGNRASRL